MSQESSVFAVRNRARLLKALGGLLLLVGFFFALVGPAELYVFFMFAEGGRFYYPGSAFGSLMFTNIATQIAGYYILAAIAVVLGLGHLRLKRWAYELVLTFSIAWLLSGLPFTLIALLMFIQAKDPTLIRFLLVLPLAALIYPIAPILIFRSYRSHDIRCTFEAADPSPSRLAAIPLRLRVLCLELLLLMLALHGMILLHGLFPFFGRMLFGLDGIVALDLLLVLLAVLTWGLASQRPWAWWGTLILFALLTLSTLLTLPAWSLRDLITLTRFAPLEIDALSNLPFIDQSPIVAALIPLLLFLGLTGWARRDIHPAAHHSETPGRRPG